MAPSIPAGAAPQRPAGISRAIVAGLATAVLAVALSGCAAGAETSAAGSGDDVGASGTPSSSAPPQPTPTVTVAPTPALPDIPRADAGLAANQPAPVVVPARVVVPSLGVDVAVEAEGLDDAGALALPADPHVASWYRFGPSPWSTDGAAVIAAHVDSLEYGLGPFAALADAPVGTPVTVTSVDGETRDFTVQTVTSADKTGIAWDEVFDRTGAARLTLITCGGEFDYDTGHYLSNIIVTAVPVA